MLAHLETIPHLLDPQGNRRLAREPACGARGRLDNGVQLPLSRLEEGLPLPCPLEGQQGVTTGDQALLGIGRSGERQHVGLRQACQVERACLHEFLDGWAPQGAHPVESWHGLQLGANARVGEQAPVTHQDHPLQMKLAAQFLELGRQRGRIPRVPREHLNSDRAARRVTHQPHHNLHLALFAIAAVAKLRQRTGTPFEIRRGEVAQDERALRQMPGREGRFEPGLAAQQPIHGAIQGIRVCRFDMQDRAQTRRRSVRSQAVGGGQLRLRGKDTSDDHG